MSIVDKHKFESWQIPGNGCNESGWDLYEDETQKEFEDYASAI